ncbi:MAG: MFS transporter [Lautropia sp.]|nr:MFS transporter [Lautropia sp.]
MNQGEVGFQPLKAQSFSGLALLLLLARVMPWLVLFAVATLGSTLPDTIHPTPARLGWLASSYFLPAALFSRPSALFVMKRGIQHSLLGVFLLTALALLLTSALPGLWGACLGMALGGVALALTQPATQLSTIRNTDTSIRPLILFIAQAGLPAAAILAGVVLPPQAGYRGWQAALPFWIPVTLFLALLVRVWVPADKRYHTTAAWATFPPRQRPPWLAALIDGMIGLTLSCCIIWLGMYAHLLAMPANGITPLMVSLGATSLLSLALLAWLGSSVTRPGLILAITLFGAALSLALLTMANQSQRWPLWLAVAGIGFTLFSGHELLAILFLPEEDRLTTDTLSAGKGNEGSTLVFPEPIFTPSGPEAAQTSTLTDPTAVSSRRSGLTGTFPATLSGDSLTEEVVSQPADDADADLGNWNGGTDDALASHDAVLPSETAPAAMALHVPEALPALPTIPQTPPPATTSAEPESVIVSPAIPQLLAAHFLGAAAGPLLLGFLTQNPQTFAHLWLLLSGLLVVAALFSLFQKRRPSIRQRD